LYHFLIPKSNKQIQLKAYYFFKKKKGRKEKSMQHCYLPRPGFQLESLEEGVSGA